MKLRFPLRGWQEKAIQLWRGAGRRGIVEVVTGGGKTVFAEACLEDTFREQPDAVAIVIVPSIALADQWAVSLEYEADVPADEIAILGSGKRATPKKFNILVINSARSKAPGLLPDRPKVLVVDECHRAGSDQNAEALKGKYVATLGLSATPERQYDNALVERLVPALGAIIYRYDLVAARGDKVVAPFELVNVGVELLADEKEQYDALTARIVRRMHALPDPSNLPEDVEALLRRRARLAALATMRIPVTVKLLDGHRGQRTMVFHEDVAAATKIAASARARGHSIALYHTGIGPALRRDNLRMYRRGMFDVLACCRALDEGVNIPETQVAIIAASSATIRQRVQRLGRVLRPAAGKDRALIYTLYATPPEEERLRGEADRLAGTALTSWKTVKVAHG